MYATFECGRLHVLVYSRTTGSVQNVSSFFLIHHSWVLKDKEEDARPTIYVFRSYDRQYSSAYQMLDACVLPADFAFVASQSNSQHLSYVRSNCGLNEENAVRIQCVFQLQHLSNVSFESAISVSFLYNSLFFSTVKTIITRAEITPAEAWYRLKLSAICHCYCSCLDCSIEL